jgi:hypothetical protein
MDYATLKFLIDNPFVAIGALVLIIIAIAVYTSLSADHFRSTGHFRSTYSSLAMGSNTKKGVTYADN